MSSVKFKEGFQPRTFQALEESPQSLGFIGRMNFDFGHISCSPNQSNEEGSFENSDNLWVVRR